MGRKTFALAATLSFAAATAASCASSQPSNGEIADACQLLADNRSWYNDLRHSAHEWGAPMGLQLAIIRQESDFDGKARPAREGGFLFIPGKRPSTAYGYSQALETTWETYKRSTGNSGADRHSFHDSVDFIGWYVNNTGKEAGVKQYDYKAHYLAYHEGPKGYLQGSWKGNSALVTKANNVAVQATRYESQIEACQALKPKFLGIF